MDEIRAEIPAEQAQAKKLEDEGLVTSIKVAMPKRAVFIEMAADNEQAALAAVMTLPMAKLWDIEIFETTPPAGAST